MNYYYDVMLNWDEEEAISFYEWNDKDALEYIKKIPIFRVSSEIFSSILGYHGKLDSTFIEMIHGKTTLHEKGILKVIDYACLISDTKNTIAIECNHDGEIISISRLLVEDELNVCEMIYGLQESNILFTKENPRKISSILRIEEETKRILKQEIETLYETNYKSKLTYLFLEWFGYTLDDISKMKDTMLKALNEPMNSTIHHIYDLVLLSYKKSGLSS